MQSIFERLKDKRKEQKELTEKEREEVAKKVLDAIRTTGVQREMYSMRAQDAIAKARRAVAAGDATGKAIAMQELKMCYGVYRYMGTLNSAYRTLDAQIQMQKITQDFAGVVNSLSSINLHQPTLNFKDLTSKALCGLKGLDLTGMENMVNELVKGTNVATSVGMSDDPFLEKLIAGEVTLDSPYAELSSTPASNPTTVSSPTATPTPTTSTVGTANAQNGDDMIESLLAQLSAGLSNS